MDATLEVVASVLYRKAKKINCLYKFNEFLKLRSIQYILNIFAYLMMLVLFIALPSPFHLLLIVYEDIAIGYNQKWWQHILMIMLTLFSCQVLLFIIRIYSNLMYDRIDVNWGLYSSRRRFWEGLFGFLQIIFGLGLLFASSTFVFYYIVKHKFTRDFIVLGITEACTILGGFVCILTGIYSEKSTLMLNIYL